MKKILLLVCIVVLSLFSVGCTKTITLTDDENYMIAEYAAELLLKYDRNTDMKYYDDSVVATPQEPVATEAETSTEKPENTAGSTEDASEKDAEEDDGTTDGSTETDNGSGGQSTALTDVNGVKADADTSFDIAAFAGEDQVSVKYAYYMILDRYPSYDHDGMYIEIEAPAGYKLLVLKFDIENKTNEDQILDLYSKGLEYSIIINDSKSAKQMLTILIDDLYTYQMTLEGSMRQEAVLLFQVSESVADKISDLKLKVEYNNDSRVIQLD